MEQNMLGKIVYEANRIMALTAIKSSKIIITVGTEEYIQVSPNEVVKALTIERLCGFDVIVGTFEYGFMVGYKVW